MKKNPVYTYTSAGEFEVELYVSDKEGLSSKSALRISAGNDPPQLVWQIDGNRTFFWPGAQMQYNVSVIDKEDGELGNGIDPANVAVSISYLENGSDINVISMGHEALATSSRFIAGKSIIDQSDCKACHFEDRESIGPSFVEVAKRYETQEDAVSYLSDKIIHGGGGVWGVNAMAAHPQHTMEEAEKMVAYILSLADKSDAPDLLPTAGSYVFAESKDHQDGSYILMASYTDLGADGVDAITSRDLIRLRSPKVDASSYDTAAIASRMTLTDDQASQAGFAAPIDIVIAADKGFIGFNQIDLTGVSQLALDVMIGPDFTGGGNIELRIDQPEGMIIGQQEVARPSSPDRIIVELPIRRTEGIKDLFLTFTGIEKKPVCILLTIDFVRGETL